MLPSPLYLLDWGDEHSATVWGRLLAPSNSPSSLISWTGVTSTLRSLGEGCLCQIVRPLSSISWSDAPSTPRFPTSTAIPKIVFRFLPFTFSTTNSLHPVDISGVVVLVSSSVPKFAIYGNPTVVIGCTRRDLVRSWREKWKRVKKDHCWTTRKIFI